MIKFKSKRWVISIFIAITILVGCANGIPSIGINIPAFIERNTQRIYIGIPILLSLNGSYAILDDEWAVTAAHNKPILSFLGREAYYHPRCDIALFKMDTKIKLENNIQGVGKVFENGEIFHSGYPVYFPMVYEEGEYIGDVISTSKPNCVASMSTGSIITGMSGGGVYNSKLELIEINVGFMSKATKKDGSVVENPTIWQSLYGVKDWLTHITGKGYYE